MIRLHCAGRYVAGQGGSSAVEFALVTPIFFALIFGIINLSSVLFAAVLLHNATEDAARCYAVKATVCTGATTTRTYALGRYQGPGIGADFAATQDGTCHSTAGTNDGHKVVGSGSFQLNAVVTSVAIPLAANACFP